MIKKAIVVAAMLGSVAVSWADSYTWTSGVLSTDNQAEVSSPLPIRGWLDRVVAVNSAAQLQTNAITVATYVGGVAGDTLATMSAADATAVVARPRRVGTPTTSTTALGAAGAVGGSTNDYYQILAAPYERIYIGGDTRVRVVQDSVAGTTQRVSVLVIYTPEE